MSRLQSRALLIAILALAAALRFAGISWGLRHEIGFDERVFVDSTAAMVASGTLDYRYYEYPGLFFYLLAPVFRMLGAYPTAGVPGILAARALVDAFGVLDVALVYLLGRRLSGTVAGLMAALFLAVSPIDTYTAQTARPDVVLQAFVTMVLIATLTVGARLRDDARAGMWIGLAAAVKFSGVLVCVPFVVRRLLTPGPRLRGLALAGGCAAALLSLSMMVSFFRPAALERGMANQWGYHFSSGFGTRFLEVSGYFTRMVLWRQMGGVLCVFAVCGALAGLRSRQLRPGVLPLFVFIATTIAVHSLAQARFARFLVPVTGAFCVLAALGIELTAPRLRLPAAALALAAAAAPFWISFDGARRVARPHAWDAVADALNAAAPPGSVVFLDAPGMGLDRERYLVVDANGDTAIDAAALRECDYAVLSPRLRNGLEQAPVLAEAADPVLGVAAARLVKIAPPLRGEHRPIDAASGQVTADGRFFELTLARPATVSRLRLPGLHRPLGGKPLLLQVSPDAQGDAFTPLRSIAIAGARNARDPIVVFAPVVARRIRLRVPLGPRRATPPFIAEQAAAQVN